jgi:cytochrome P450
MSGAGEAFFFNPFDEAVRRDPYALFARARRAHPAWRHEGLPVVSVFRHADCQTILRDAHTWSSRFPTPPGFAAEDVPRSMIVTDPPEHGRLRGLVNQAFTPKRVRQLAPRIEILAHELLDQAMHGRAVDLVDALTYPLPVVVIAEMMGVPAEDRAQFKAWSGRSEPRDDLLSALVAAELEGSRLSFEEMMAMLTLLLVAGNETTTNLIGNAVLELLAHPDALAELRADPALLPGAVEEVLRFSSPVQMDPRRATRAVELHGVRVEPDEFVLCWLGSANRDEAVFDAPDVFDIRRAKSPHLSFGFGPHYCLGASLATLEAEVALRVLLARTRDFRRVDDALLPFHPSIVFRGVRSLPLVLDAA